MPGLTHDRKKQRLADLPLFSECTSEQIRQISSLAAWTKVPIHHALCCHGRPGHEFFVIIDGEATVMIDGTCIATLGPDCGFGEVASLTVEGRRTATITAATPMTLLVFDRVEFVKLLDLAPIVARRVLRESTSRLATTSQSRGLVASP